MSEGFTGGAACMAGGNVCTMGAPTSGGPAGAACIAGGMAGVPGFGAPTSVVIPVTVFHQYGPHMDGDCTHASGGEPR